MFDKILSLVRDIVIYLIPGIISSYFIVLLMGSDILPLVKESVNLAILVLAISFGLGFLISQLQIIVFWILIKKKEKYKTLRNCSMSSELKEKVAKQVISVFQLGNSYTMELALDDLELHEMCNEYVKVIGSYEIYAPIERDAYLSSFGISLYLPTILGLFVFLDFKNLFLGWDSVSSIAIFLAFALGLALLIHRIAMNFRRGKTERIFQQFLVLSLTEEKRDSVKVNEAKK